jgi:hypothetical protein
MIPYCQVNGNVDYYVTHGNGKVVQARLRPA